MDEAWTALWTQGAQSWPQLTVSQAQFMAFVDPSLDPQQLLGPDLYFACAVALGQPEALLAFEHHYIEPIVTYLGRRELSSAHIQETQQRTRLRILVADPGKKARIHEFSGRGALGGWVRIVALREHVNLHRQKDPQWSDSDNLPAPTALSPELAAVRQKYLGVLNAALKAAIANLETRQKTLFRLHYVDGLSFEKIGSLYAVNKGTVSRWLAAAREQVLARALAQVQTQVGTSGRDAHSLFQLLQSQLELNLSEGTKTNTW